MSYYQTKRRSYGGSSRNYSRNRSSNRGPKKENIHISKFIKPARPVEQEAYEPTNLFPDFEVSPKLHANILKKGFTIPTPIQDQAIPLGLSGQDVIGIANTGTGKTVAFAVPVIDKLLSNPSSRALIVAPTRELAQQIIEEFADLASGSGLFGALLIGGTSMGPQYKELARRPSIVIGTPGRIKDHQERGNLKLAQFDLVVLDEVDRMLDMGFVGDMREILSAIPPTRQSFFFSATMTPQVNKLIDEFSRGAQTISVKSGDTTDNVEQDVVRFRSHSEKLEMLHNILIENKDCKALIFNETQRSVEKLSTELRTRGFQADSIHGGKSQSQRQRALNKFKESHTNVLVATDVAARGIDVADITHVINYTTPQSYSDYTHRVGRAGRAGRTGFALTFVEA